MQNGMPRWVRVFAAIGVVLLVVFAAFHLAGRGAGGHLHHAGTHP